MKKRIAAIQLNTTPHVQQNMADIAHHVAAAAQEGAKLILLPENALFMGAKQQETRALAEPLGGGQLQQQLAELAGTHHVWLLVGAMPIIENNTIYQTLLVYNAAGEQVAHYHKRHLFNVTLPNADESYRESDAFSAGDNVVVVNTPVGNVGLAICYDLRFPEHFRQLVEKGAEILVLPAAFTDKTGEAHWEILLRARAIENQCYILAAAQTGKHANGRATWGHSMIIEPWGNVVAELASETGIVVAEIDLAQLHHQRTVFPALQHRQS